MAQHVPPSAHTRIYTCNWDWCRLAFPTNPSLVYHVIHDHVRKAQPVRRRDLPFLRRVEDGVGESWRLSGSVGVDDGEYFQLLCSLVWVYVSYGF